MSTSVQTPFDLFGPLLAAVQTHGIFPDGKTFVDARPLRAVDAIMADFAALSPGDDAALADLVRVNFALPQTVGVWTDPRAASLEEHIRAGWKHLSRNPEIASGSCSRLPIGHRHVVPGGRFRELYYWDSFFTMLGLMRDGEVELATGMVDAMTDLIEQYGHVPNGTRSYYVGRSQPPLYHMMVALLGKGKPGHTARRLEAMKAEHAWWMRGEESLVPGQSEQRVVMLGDGSVLNRYWDPRSTPRDESWREDVETAAASWRSADEVYRELRAGAESGWDFSSRWLDVVDDLSSIRTTTIVPIDLNAFLYSLEMAIAGYGDDDALEFARRANLRLVALHTHCWSHHLGCFADYDLTKQSTRPPTAASLTPLLCGVATFAQAEATAQFGSEHLLAPGGVRTSLVSTEQQWDAPNGWAPLQWMAVQGLENYGHKELAATIARRWIATVSTTFRETGLTHEKYDIESCSVGAGGEYEPQIGFGWTNGVTRALIERYGVAALGKLSSLPISPAATGRSPG